MADTRKLLPKLSAEKRAEIAERYSLGETYYSLAKEFGVAATTIKKYVDAINARQEKPLGSQVTPAKAVSDFAKRARSIMWRLDKDRKSYKKWEDKVEDFKKGGMNPKQAIVQASKDFPCLKKLFREYCVTEYDPHPGSHPDIHEWGKPDPGQAMECEERNQSTHENILWAIAAAGEFLRTNIPPEKCPNNAAFYLYRQACEEPKDFLGKFTQVDARSGDELNKQHLAKSGGERSISEINEMLNTLTEGE